MRTTIVCGLLGALVAALALAGGVATAHSPGANGQIAANYVKGLAPDGYSILYVASSTVVTSTLSYSLSPVFLNASPIAVASGAASGPLLVMLSV